MVMANVRTLRQEFCARTFAYFMLTTDDSGVPRGGGVGVFKPPPRNSEGPPKSYQTQPGCENC